MAVESRKDCILMGQFVVFGLRDCCLVVAVGFCVIRLVAGFLSGSSTSRSRSSLPPSAHRKAVFLLVVRYREIPLMMLSRDPVEEPGRGGSVADC